MIHLGTKTIETERLILRRINENDYIKAYTVKKGTLPDIVQCFKTKRGIC